MRRDQLRERSDNAMILAHAGKTIDSRGDEGLLAELRKEVREDYKKRRNSHIVENEISTTAASDTELLPSSTSAANKTANDIS